MDPNDVYAKLRVAIPMRPELRFKTWPKNDHKVAIEYGEKNPYGGACYIATQVFCHLVDEAIPFSDKDRSHFWAQIDGTIYDPTADQFDYPFPYEKGKRTKFPRGLTKRSASLLETVLSL